jgi:hypothetical protein
LAKFFRMPQRSYTQFSILSFNHAAKSVGASPFEARNMRAVKNLTENYRKHG